MMKRFKYFSIYFASGLMLLTVILSSCKKDFFDLEDTTGIDSRIWNDEGAVGLFLNRTYNLIIPQWPTLGGIHNTSDEMNSASTAFLYGTLNENSVTDIGTSAGNNGNRYYDIRRCNVALAGLDTSSINPAANRLFKGQFYFLRAMAYFKLVSIYGGVPLVLDPTEYREGESLDVPRAKTSECIAQIVKDLDSATVLLPASWPPATDAGRVTRGASLAYKGRVLLYWASPQFNPTNISSRWEAAYQANKAAYDQLVADNYGLIAKYSDIFLVENNREVIIVKKYAPNRDLGHNIEHQSRPFSETQGGGGSLQPTWNQVQSYPMSNGLPITHASSGYNSVMFWQNRDPRFEASIAYNGALWPLSNKPTRRQWTYQGTSEETTNSQTGFYSKRFINPTLTPAQAVYNSNSGGGNGMDWVELRFAEVMLNLAEAANETGRLVEAKSQVRTLRQRAGIVAGTLDYGLGIANDMASMRTLLLNERQVEFALEGKRYWDLRRTRNFSMISARLAYRWTPKAPYVAGTGNDATKIYLDKPDAFGVRPKDTANLNNQSVYTSMFTTSTVSLEGSNVIDIPESYYFYALPNFFSQYFIIQQTLGWVNGTFDPLQ
jgi:starch-binding outer membrane protein, SusD/RagB family